MSKLPTITAEEKKFGEVRGEVNGLKGYLEGRMLTIMDALFSDPLQRKAAKDLVREAIWSQEFFSENIYKIITGREGHTALNLTIMPTATLPFNEG